MKLNIPKPRRAGLRLDAVLFVVALLWLLASLLLIVLYRPAAAHASQPQRPAHEFMARSTVPLRPPAPF
jgi:hypothetical protein